MTSTKQLNSNPTKSDILQRSTAYEVGQDPFRVSSADGNGNQETYQSNGLGLLGDLTQTIKGQDQISSYGYNKLRQTTVYNFEVKDFNSYFISDLGVWETFYSYSKG